MKLCGRCKITKCDEDFRKSCSSKDGMQYYCKSCQKSYSQERYAKNPQKYKDQHAKWAVLYKKNNPQKNREVSLRSVFGITIEDYDRMFLEQNGVCLICKKPETVIARGKIRNLSIDHDHITGKIRGLLCNGHNTGLGKFDDSVELLEEAIRYLKRSRNIL